jgi:hypothetical protein
MKCEICGREFKNYISLGQHLRACKITSNEYYDRFLRKDGEGICPICGKETTYLNLGKGYRKFCSNKCARSGKNNPMFGKHHSEETREKMSDAKKGRRLSEETKKKLSDANKGENNFWYGKHHTEETKKKISNARKGKYAGKNNPNWKGGISLKEFKNAYGLEPTDWQKLAQEIRKRDNFICQLCGKKGATDVHHIIPRRIKIDNSPDNLITLCRSCHAKIEHLTDIYLSEGKDPKEIFYKNGISI